jgi:hypothetical protein
MGWSRRRGGNAGREEGSDTGPPFPFSNSLLRSCRLAWSGRPKWRRAAFQSSVEANKVRLVITKPTLLKDLFESKPPTVYMTVTTPEFAIRMKVAVDYKE